MDGAPAIGARVSVLWNDVRVATDGPRVVQQAMELTAPTASNGVYHACNIPLATTLLVTITSADGSSAALLRTSIDSGKVRFLDVVAGDGTKHTISGRVVDASGRIVSGAQLSVTGVARTWTTDANGLFRLPDIPSGTRTLELSALGYEPHHQRVDVGLSAAPMEVNLSHRAAVLDSVRTTAQARDIALARYRPFENRRQNGFGYFMTEKQIAEMHVISTDEIMRRVPSVAVLLKHSSRGDSLMVVSRRGRTSLEQGLAEKPVCSLDIFIDGRRSDASDIQQPPPSEIHGIEVHGVATTPVEYHAGQCGAVLIWTK